MRTIRLSIPLHIFLFMSFVIPGLLYSQNVEWVLQNSGTDRNLNSVWFISPYEGWASGDSGLIIHSSDGGETWEQQPTGSGQKLNDITFYDDAIGVAVGDSGTILKTVDGGAHWNLVEAEVSSNLLKVHFADTLLLAGGEPYSIGSSEDMGQSWSFDEDTSAIQAVTSIWSAEASVYLWAVYYPDLVSSIGFFTCFLGIFAAVPLPLSKVNDAACGAGEFTIKTGIVTESGHLKFAEGTCGGFPFNSPWHTWTSSAVTDSSPLNSVSFVGTDLDSFIVVGDSGFIASTHIQSVFTLPDWIVEESGVTENLNEVSSVPNGSVWAVGDNGIILKRVTVTGIKSNFDDVNSKSFVIYQNWPNPFNAVTMIAYSLSKPGNTKLIVYDLQGHEIVKLIDGYVESGNHSVSWDAAGYPSGVYIYRLTSGNFAKTRKMVLLK